MSAEVDEVTGLRARVAALEEMLAEVSVAAAAMQSEGDELLRALEVCLKSFGAAHAHLRERPEECACNIARAAIAKARGGT